jgi:hypothetical protein
MAKRLSSPEVCDWIADDSDEDLEQYIFPSSVDELDAEFIEDHGVASNVTLGDDLDSEDSNDE